MIPLHNRNFACKYCKHLCNNKGGKHRQFILILVTLQAFIQDGQVEITITHIQVQRIYIISLLFKYLNLYISLNIPRFNKHIPKWIIRTVIWCPISCISSHRKYNARSQFHKCHTTRNKAQDISCNVSFSKHNHSNNKLKLIMFILSAR